MRWKREQKKLETYNQVVKLHTIKMKTYKKFSKNIFVWLSAQAQRLFTGKNFRAIWMSFKFY